MDHPWIIRYNRDRDIRLTRTQNSAVSEIAHNTGHHPHGLRVLEAIRLKLCANGRNNSQQCWDLQCRGKDTTHKTL